MAASISSGRIEVFLSVSGAVTDAKFVIISFADSTVNSIAYIYIYKH